MKNIKKIFDVGLMCFFLFHSGIHAETNIVAKNEKQATFDFMHQSPLDFLDYLKYPIYKYQNFYTVEKELEGWVRLEHIPYLIELLDSKEPCIPVQLAISSDIRGASTIGQEAAFLIQGFRDGKYPSMLNSDQASKEEVLKWWQSFKKSQESISQ